MVTSWQTDQTRTAKDWIVPPHRGPCQRRHPYLLKQLHQNLRIHSYHNLPIHPYLLRHSQPILSQLAQKNQPEHPLIHRYQLRRMCHQLRHRCRQPFSRQIHQPFSRQIHQLFSQLIHHTRNKREQWFSYKDLRVFAKRFEGKNSEVFDSTLT